LTIEERPDTPLEEIQVFRDKKLPELRDLASGKAAERFPFRSSGHATFAAASLSRFSLLFDESAAATPLGPKIDARSG
jgi:hypothetical protein